MVSLAALAKALHHSLCRRPGTLITNAATHGVKELTKLRRGNFQFPTRDIVLNLIRRSLKTDDSFASHIVQTAIKKHQRVVPYKRFVILPTFVAPTSAHLEHVYKIGFKRDLDQQLCIRLIEVRERD